MYAVKKVLVTGFKPFDGRVINSIEQVVKVLAGRSLPDIELLTAVLPVDRYLGSEELIKCVREKEPDAVLCLGEAKKRPS